jgi:hypothetical protein
LKHRVSFLWKRIVAAVTNTPLTIGEAAERLGLTPRQLKYAIQRGAPTIQRGRKGRTHKTLVDPEAVRHWMRSRRDPTAAAHRRLARELIATMAENTALQFQMQAGAHKGVLLGNLLAGFFSTAAAIHQQLGLPEFELADVPGVIRKMDAANVHLSGFSIIDSYWTEGARKRERHDST